MPLYIEEVAEVIAVNVKSQPRIDLESRFFEPRDILTICSSLVTTNTDATGPSDEKRVSEQIKFVHLSVKDYLTSKWILAGKAAKYSIQEISAHESMGQVCLAYLLQFDKPDSLPEGWERDFPLARYAAEYWAQHIRSSGKETDETIQLAWELFSNPDTFANWIRIFDSDKVSAALIGTRASTGVAVPLYYTAQAGLKETVRLVIENGADVNAVSGAYSSALQAASAGRFGGTVKLLLDQGATVNAQGGLHGDALQAASFNGHSKVVQILLDKKANVNGEAGLYGNALHAASAEGHEETVQQLINSGANVNALGGQYGSALHAAPFGGHDSVLQRLLNAGGNIELGDNRGTTPLYQAARGG
jgi:hypothetical protein